MLDLTDAVGHVAFLFIGLGMLLLGKKNPLGFLSQMLGSAIWIVVGYSLELSSIVLWNILFCLIGFNGYRNLRRK